jgi:hypothetical protein
VKYRAPDELLLLECSCIQMSVVENMQSLSEAKLLNHNRCANINYVTKCHVANIIDKASRSAQNKLRSCAILNSAMRQRLHD